MEHRASTEHRHLVRFFASFFSSPQFRQHLSMSLFIDLLQVSFGLPLFLFPVGFQSRDCLVISLSGFRRVWPIHLQVFLLIVFPISSWPVRCHNSVFSILVGQKILRILRRHLFIKVCSILVVVLFIFQVSQPYRSTDLTLVLKILISVFSEMLLAFQIFSSILNV